jgi:tetratricopeptide (TPR) repeat protein
MRAYVVLAFVPFLLSSAGAGPPSAEPRQRELAGLEFFQPALPYSAELVGSEKCGSCHVEHLRRQKEHHMALTGRAVTAQTVPLWFSRERLAKPVRWPSESGPAAPRYRARPDQVFLEAADTTGQVRSARVAAVFGSGARGFTPLSAEEGKAVRELRLSFSSPHDSWLMTPGSDGDPDALGTPRSAEQSRDCISCHATVIAWRASRLDAEASVFGVQCERCHGPGSAHVQAVLEQSEAGKIFNPGSLRADRQVEFCGQCHRRPTDLDPFDVLNRAPGLARHAAASLMLSACFRRSPPAETISCLDCHDPHRNIDAASDPFRATCLRCHASPEREHWSQAINSSSDCVGCHMPVETKAFHGVRFTDHWIRTPASPVPLGSRRQDEYLRYLEESYRQAVLRPGLGPEKAAKLRVNLGEVLFGREQYDTAFRWLREGLSLSPSYAQRLRAAAMFRQRGSIEDAVGILEEAIRAEPGRADAYYQQGELLQRQGRLDAAAGRYREALERRPEFPGAHNSLGSVLGSRGQLGEAMTHFRRAIELKPDYAEAHQNLGLALQRSGRLVEALAEFKESVRLKPDWPAALHSLARILATHPDESVRIPSQAVQLADRAAELTLYEDPVVLDTLAAAYAAAGRFEKAVAAAEEALKRLSGPDAEALAEQFRARLELYRRKEPYRDSPRR